MTNLPQASIAYVAIGDHSSRKVSTSTVHGSDTIDCVRLAMQRMREINAHGGSVLYVDFLVDGNLRRRYTDGRVTRPRKSLTTED